MDVSIPPVDQFYRHAEYIRCVDADTLVLDVDNGWNQHLIERFRIARCDAPESNRYPEMPAGQWVTGQVRTWIGDAVEVAIHSTEFNPDQWGRCVAEVWIEGHNLSQWLLDHNYVWPTDDKGQVIGPRDIERLIGIPEMVRKQVTDYVGGYV